MIAFKFLAIIAEIIATCAPAESVLVTGVAVGGVTVTAATIIPIACIAAGLAGALYALVRFIRKKQHAKEELQAKEVKEQVVLMKKTSAGLLKQMCSIVENIEDRYTQHLELERKNGMYCGLAQDERLTTLEKEN